MHAFVLVTVVSLFPVLGAAFQAEPGKDAKPSSATLDGTWVPVSAELAGQKFPEEAIKAWKLVIVGEKYTVHVGDQLDQGTVKIDAKSAPKLMDILGVEGPNKGKTFLAIYELRDGALHICYDLAGKQRPAEFKTSAGTQQFLVHYKRMLPAP